ncbi:MAG: hypothetical protein QW743_04360 [Candidatus Methanomethylicia archaeon]
MVIFIKKFSFIFVNELAGDIVRVLALSLGRLWFSELVAEVNAFRSTLGISEIVDEDSIRNSLKFLESNGIVYCEDRLRSQLLGESVKDTLVSLLNYDSIINELKNDERYNAYISKYRSSFLSFT